MRQRAFALSLLLLSFVTQACGTSDRAVGFVDTETMGASAGGSAGAGGSAAAGGTGSLSKSCDTLDAGPMPLGAPGTCAAGSFCELLSEAQFQALFPNATAPYSYDGLIAAADGYYPSFTRVGDLPARKREAAAFLANVSHESGGFRYAEELACDDGQWMTNPDCQVYLHDGVSYYGRGAIQLSFYNNYSAASKALCVDLVSNPDQVATNPVLAIGTAVWFWMERGACHDAIVGGKGFGATVQAINPIECSSDDPVRIGEWQDRLNLFTTIAGVMGIDPGDTSGCR
ncbi:MAG TPA: chitinase [Polyangiaceae bacterium]|jgi:predicted chitinase|nr:chitinase [Polyangiaceae bacterium]